ncbi:MAG TPA: ABC transporter ATP-binding protein/permease [Candidatus Corynebacterium avicola]|uniref:ABC transporter ATP-binding protein/permease n=1 Tax=Candidatus Corynebacterium avicola TaxID=2838527 RepID=A0A9D1ULI7_9CORY|nr:ABC transporter ATP-binding protein/permease [Candidatus Corynebacterium avicola]
MLTKIRAIIGGGADYRAYVALTVISSILQAASVVVLFPLLEDLFGPNSADAWPWVLLLVALIAASWAIDIVSAHKGLSVGLALMHAICGNTPTAVLNWPATDLNRKKLTDLRRLVSQGSLEVTSAPVLLLGPVITAPVFTVALAVGLAFVNIPVAIVTLVGALLMMGAFQLSGKLTERADKEFANANATLDDRLFDFARAQPSLRTARRVSTGARLVDDAIGEARGRTLKLLLWQLPGEILFSLVLQVVLLGFGVTVWLAYDDGTLTGVAAAATVIVMLRVIEQVNGISGSATGIRNLGRTLDEAAEATAVAASAPATPPAALGAAPSTRLEKVGVRFADGTVGVDGVDLDLAPGTVTVVVGRSGSGKTTLLRTLAGLTDVADGRVVLDDNAADTTTLRSNASMVFQDTELGTGSVRDNLTAVNPDLSQEDLDRLADAAGLRTILESIPTGWDTPVGELGNRLSGGERQRVGIARALAKPSHLLLVDEATSALDARNEAAVVDSIRTVRGDYTTVIVTHRPATLEIADTVVVLDDGKIVEQGTPAELSAAGGAFARIAEEWRNAAQWRV